MNRTVLIGVIGGVLLLLALFLTWLSTDSPPPPPTDTTPAVQSGDASSSTQDSTAPAPENTGATTETGNVTTDSKDTTGASDSGVTDQKTTPSFDVVRIDPNGDTVIAGRAEPGSTVTIIDNDKDLGSVDADSRGEWVYLPGSPLEPGPHELTLRSQLPEKEPIEGDGKVVLVVPAPGKDVAGRDTDSDTPQSPVVVLVPNKDKPGAELLQAPPRSSGLAEPGGVQNSDGTLSVETIDYDPDGNISVSGKGPLGSVILGYLDNRLIGSGHVEEDGKWRIDPKEEISPGIYTMRFDAVRSNSVIARLEIPFSRAAPLTDLQGDSFIIVQPGNSLWRIARRALGSGYNYTVIYEANADQIIDPDLIYPGQVFEVPNN
ncbi:MAG: LysM peptidoglycan-binding domain-containing protein [Alphaproteobacteria bacterium]|nr:LysM peptidoglycan-binding domain-containing protein [Alphaproteobacteria bacterium]